MKNKSLKKESVNIYADKTDEGYSKIHQMVSDVLKGENS